MDQRERSRQPVFIACAAAIILAPFLALLWSVPAGLTLMAVALAACGLLLQGATAGAPQSAHRWIRAVIVANLVLAGICVIAMVYFLTC